MLTEDNELTPAILHLGFRILCPRECVLTTEVMPTWGDLARQRLRWKRSALDNLIDYGWTPIMRPRWGRQPLSLVGILVVSAYLLSIAYSLIWLGLQAIWLGTAMFTRVSAGPAVKRLLPSRES